MPGSIRAMSRTNTSRGQIGEGCRRRVPFGICMLSATCRLGPLNGCVSVHGDLTTALKKDIALVDFAELCSTYQ